MQKFFLALRYPSFTLLWFSEVFSQIAMNMLNFILLLVAYSLTNSNTAVSGIVLSFTIPATVFGVLAGAYVDRWNKKNVLVATNVLRAILVFVLGVLHTNLLVVYTISFLGAIITQFFIPAETPIIPQIVAREHLISANALFSMAWFGSVLIAYALSGPFLLLFGTTNAMFLLAGTFVLASVCAFLIKYRIVDEKGKPAIQERVHIGIEIKRAFSAILKIRDVTHAFSLLVLSQVLLLVISVLGPGYAKQILGISVNAFPLLFVTPAVIGMAVGAYLVANFFHGFNRHKSANIGLFIAAGVVLLMPYGSKVASQGFVQTLNAILPHILDITILHVMVILAFLLGVANSFMFVPSNTLVQENTSDELRGKVYGALNSMASFFSIIPVIMVGSLADLFGVGNVLTGIGVIIGLIGIFRLFI
ncbi:MAG: MFS transporter [Patescibacteria group bacterium]|nr:MFS transporter [Patescibacteria group bacterium]MDE2590863.1 MFS transporter [Patescibacteria group bacterium]